jgi:adenine specific DNA methylase Mod
MCVPKTIYIDPPYNTGNEKWVYNDNVNSPKIKEWLGKVVGAEGEDLTRHDKWLCMMYPRLKLLRDLLRDDGVIFVSIGDDEHCLLRLMFDEIFGEENFVANFIWNHRKSSQNDIDVSLSHNYTICFAKDREIFRLNRLEIDGGKFSNPNNDKRGNWVADPMDAPGIRENLMYPIINPMTKEKFLPPVGRHWRFTKEKFEEAIRDNRIVFGKTGKSKPQYKRFESEAEEKGVNVFTIWDDVGTATEGTQELMEIFKGQKVFETPKPASLIKKIIKLSTDKDSIILDSFAGSGTTAQAVLELNKEDSGNRKFVLVELEKEIARKITAERVKRVSKNLKGSFNYMELDGTLFTASQAINPEVKFNDLARYIFFTETNEHGDEKAIKGNFIGESNGTDYYLIFDPSKKCAIDTSFLNKMKKSDSRKVVYADKCLLDGDDLSKYNITFKQIPYEVKVY